MCCVCVPTAQLRVEGSTYLLRAVFPTLIPLFACCFHEQMFWEISWCTLFKFSLLAYLSVYPLIYILQYIVYTLHTVHIYTATCLHTHPSSMSAYEKNLQKIAICPHSLELSAVYIRLHNAVRQLQAGSPAISRQSVRQACMTACTAKTVRHAPPPPCRKCITNSIRNCHLQIKRWRFLYRRYDAKQHVYSIHVLY